MISGLMLLTDKHTDKPTEMATLSLPFGGCNDRLIFVLEIYFTWYLIFGWWYGVGGVNTRVDFFYHDKYSLNTNKTASRQFESQHLRKRCLQLNTPLISSIVMALPCPRSALFDAISQLVLRIWLFIEYCQNASDCFCLTAHVMIAVDIRPSNC